MIKGEGSTKDYSPRRAIDHLNFQAGKAESDSWMLIQSESKHPDLGRLESGLFEIEAFRVKLKINSQLDKYLFGLGPPKYNLLVELETL